MNLPDLPQPRRGRLRARPDPRLVARLSIPRPIHFDGASPAEDLPGHLRAGSAVRTWGDRLVIVQDDVNALALVDRATGRAEPLLLPRGSDGRRMYGSEEGNKALKMDLEAAFALPDGRLVALGSGSTSRRERLVVLRPGAAPRVLDAQPLYAALTQRPDFAGSELNLEGATVVGSVLRLFQRGNGAPRGQLEPVNAIGDLDLGAFLAWLAGGPAPALGRVSQVDLGEIGGVPFGFTDAATLPDGRVAFLAGAEDSPDTYSDGKVVGCLFGIIDGDEITTAPILGYDGLPTELKLEGIEWSRSIGEGVELIVVADMDDPAIPAVIADLQVSWGGGSERR